MVFVSMVARSPCYCTRAGYGAVEMNSRQSGTGDKRKGRWWAQRHFWNDFLSLLILPCSDGFRTPQDRLNCRVQVGTFSAQDADVRDSACFSRILDRGYRRSCQDIGKITKDI